LFHLFAALATAVCTGLGIKQTIAQFWTCDDAFISFRYAENLVGGHGLVFNVGERVEGYTNFAWTLLIALGMRLGIDPLACTRWLGLGCLLATLLLLVGASRRISGGGPWLPIAACALALNPHVQLFATGGLETPLFWLLVTLLLLLAAWAERPATFVLTGAVGTLAAMTRPDGLLPCAIVGTWALWRAACRRLPWRCVLALALPGILLFVPYFWWKWSYYGDPLPNTFYAKTAHDPYLSQGLLYLRLFFGCYWGLALGGLAVVTVAFVRPQLTHARTDGLSQLTLAFVAGYLAFVAWVGGDFMFGRFVMPVTPALYLGFELLRRRWVGTVSALILFVLAVAGTVLRNFPAQLHDKGEISGIVEEPTYYPAHEVAHKQRCAEQLARLYGDHESRIAIGGAQAMLAYYGKFDLVLECAAGLTDRYIARLPVPAGRARIGHEKSGMLDPRYVANRRVQFLLDTLHPPPAEPDHTFIDFGGFWGKIVTYDRPLMRHLKQQPGVRFLDCESFLDELIPKLPHLPRAEVETLWRTLELYYFDANTGEHADPVRQAAFTRVLGDLK
jgi:hypothetical protein